MNRFACVVVALFAALAVGCGGNDGEEAAPTPEGPSPVPADSQPLPDELEGVWRTVDQNALQYLVFAEGNADCEATIDTETCLASAGPEPKDVYLVSRVVATDNQIALDNEKRSSLVEASREGPEPCPGSALYAYRIDDGKLTMARVVDNCPSRVRLFTSVEWERQS